MNTSKKNLIDIAAFRKANNMAQKDLATFLGTSRSFVSSIESGRSMLPQEKLRYIYEVAEKDRTLVAPPICPHYHRLCLVDQYLKATGQMAEDEGILERMPAETLTALRMGRAGIPLYFAEKLCKKYSNISKGWLMTGDGCMEENANIADLNAKIMHLTDDVHRLESMLARMEDSINKIERKFGY